MQWARVSGGMHTVLCVWVASTGFACQTKRQHSGAGANLVINAAYVHHNALPSVDDIGKEGLQEFISGWNRPPMPPQLQSQARKAMKTTAASNDNRKPKLSVLNKATNGKRHADARLH